MCGRHWQAILEGNFGANKSLSAKDMAKLLKYGAYDIMKNDADDASRRFCEEDIEAILTHRSSKISHEKQVKEGGSSFSKATFVHSNDENSRIFWKTVMPDASSRSESTDELLVDGPRSRKQVLPQISKTPAQATAARGNGDDVDCGSSDSSSEDEDRPKKRQKQKQEQPPKSRQWAKAERDRLLKAILLLGRDRWDDVYAEAKVRRPQDEVTFAGKALLAKIEEPQKADAAATQPAPSDAAATQPAPTASQTEQADDVFAEPKFVEALKQQAKSHIEKLDAMTLIAKRINVVVSAEDAKKSHTWIGPDPSDSRLPCLHVQGSPGLWCTSHYACFPSCWYPTRKHRRVVGALYCAGTSKHDIELLIGIFKYERSKRPSHSGP